VTRSLDLVVTAVATQLMAADAANAAEISQRILADLVAYFDVVFKLSENSKKPHVFRPEPATDEYQKTIEDSGGQAGISMAAAPLVSGDVTTGVLGFVKVGDREWRQEELNALEAIGSLFAQLKARIAAEEQLRYLAEHDDLTGVYNRRALIAHLEDRLAEGRPGPVTVLFLDLDRLKAVNDYLGHNAGDRFIRVFAERLRAKIADDCLIARLGGDEFVVVPAAAVDAQAAQHLAVQLQGALRERVSIDGEMLTRTVSVGVAQGTPGVDSASDVLRKADQAVLEAKDAGGNKVASFTEDLSMRTAFRNDIELHLQGVIESGALVLHYLPEVDMRTGQVMGTEALVRWQHPTRGLLFPDSFIGVAESINLAGELGRWVLRSACAEFARWRSQGIGLDAVMRVNVSPVQLVAAGFADTVGDILAEFGLSGDAVCLEITESLVVQDIETARITLGALKAVGVRIAIDDFGTGYSVLSHLKSLPVDTVKIDKSFVRDLGSNAGDLAIVRAIIALAEAFGLQVVAEGVETISAAQTLIAHRCRRAQGYLLSRPLEGDGMRELLQRGRIDLPFGAAPIPG
jgi:diguanylate cyclase (GGDEF)-like protein